MRVIIMFDLPTKTKQDIKNYNKFRKYLIKTGFYMMQESIYCKLTLNATAAELLMKQIRFNKPPAGLVQMMVITEKQFSKIEYLVGEKRSDVIDSDERLLFL